MNWKILSRAIDVYELTEEDWPKKYIVYVLDETRRPIAAEEAYGIPDRTKVVKRFIAKYGQYIVNIEHEDN